VCTSHSGRGRAGCVWHVQSVASGAFGRMPFQTLSVGGRGMQLVHGNPDFVQMHSAIWQPDLACASGSVADTEIVRGTRFSLVSSFLWLLWFHGCLCLSQLSSTIEVHIGGGGRGAVAPPLADNGGANGFKCPPPILQTLWNDACKHGKKHRHA